MAHPKGSHRPALADRSLWNISKHIPYIQSLPLQQSLAKIKLGYCPYRSLPIIYMQSGLPHSILGHQILFVVLSNQKVPDITSKRDTIDRRRRLKMVGAPTRVNSTGMSQITITTSNSCRGIFAHLAAPNPQPAFAIHLPIVLGSFSLRLLLEVRQIDQCSYFLRKAQRP